MDGISLLFGAAGVLGCLGAYESWAHRRNLRRIPIRIHVNGTRGKSSVTRLIAAGLREGGVRTFAKMTGTLPRAAFPDGSEYPVFRPSRANVIEQVRIVKAAAASGAEAMVIECMALQPNLQALCELQLVQATHGVITNARADHLDVMGPTSADVALALAGTTPQGGKLFTAEQKLLGVFEKSARDRGAELIAIGDEQKRAVTHEDLRGFRHIEHPDNVALALSVCADVGIDRATALRGMWKAPADVGVMSTHAVRLRDRRIVFVNGFAANDPESTGQNWEMALSCFPDLEKKIAVFNCRADRPERSVQLAEMCVQRKPADHYLLIGSATHLFERRAAAMGLNPSKITNAENRRIDEIVARVSGLADRSSLVMGMGNIGGPGLEMLRYFETSALAG